MAMTATSGVVSAKNAACKARGYRPIEERVKKVRLKHGRDRERTSACVTAGYSRDSILPSARPTLTPIGKEKRQTSRARVLTGHKKIHRATICEGVYTNTLRVVEGIRHEKRYIGKYIGTIHSEEITYNTYIQQQK